MFIGYIHTYIIRSDAVDYSLPRIISALMIIVLFGYGRNYLLCLITEIGLLEGRQSFISISSLFRERKFVISMIL